SAAEKAVEISLGEESWEVVRDEKNRVARPIPADAKSEAEETGREVVFRTTVGEPALTVTKTFRLRKGVDGFEMELAFDSPGLDRKVVYKMLGPHGIPIEGEWYTSTFRDAFFAQADNGRTKIVTKSADDVAKQKDEPERFQALPLVFAGVENQYYATLIESD